MKTFNLWKPVEPSTTANLPPPPQAAFSFQASFEPSALVLKKGFLEKKGEKGLIKTFKKRWFLFTAAGQLRYRETVDGEDLGVIDVTVGSSGKNFLTITACDKFVLFVK